MADPIPPTDIALIAEAIAAGRVQRVPTGVFGEDPYATKPWRQQINEASRAGKARHRKSPKPKPVETKAEARKRKNAERQAVRRVQVAIMTEAGATAKAIALAMGVCECTIDDDRRVLRAAGRIGKGRA